jgi:hypothetical protein
LSSLLKIDTGYAHVIHKIFNAQFTEIIRAITLKYYFYSIIQEPTTLE